jgi:hypothetical protein
MDMSKKKTKRILFSIIIVLIIGCIVGIIISSLGVIVHDVEGARYVNDYKEFYLYKKDYEPFFSFNFGTGGLGKGYKVWFLPGQKQKLLEKIKEDVNTELKNIVANNRDIIKNYEISDDFKKIYVYYYKDAYNYELNRESAHRIYELASKLSDGTVRRKVELYHEFIHGSGYSMSQIVNFVEVK